MEQLTLLWDYQQADIEVEKMEVSIKRSPTRQKLTKARDFLVAQQKKIQDIQEEVGNMVDRLGTLKDAVTLVNEQFRAWHDKIEQNPPTDIEQIKKFEKEGKRLKNNLIEYEKEMKKIRKDLNDRERMQRDIKLQAAKRKAEFDKLKVDFDAEYKGQLEELAKLKGIALKKEEQIAPEAMTRYRAIKKSINPPIAKLYSDQCGGCNMSLPSAVVRAIKAGKRDDCENCGRILYID